MRDFSHRDSQFTGLPGKGEVHSFYSLRLRASNEHSDIYLSLKCLSLIFLQWLKFGFVECASRNKQLNLTAKA